jgi:hypothetical protein
MSSNQKLDHEGQVLIGQFCHWVVFWPERDVNLRPLHSSIWLDALSQADLSFKLFSLCLRDDRQAAPKDHIDLIHLVFIVSIRPMMFSSTRLLRHLRCWHLLAVQKSLALLQIVSCGAMDFAPLLCIIREMELPLLLLLRGLLLVIFTVSTIPAICSVDLPIILLLLS